MTDMAALSLAACMSNGLEAVSATNDTAGEAEAGTEKKEGIGVYWVGKTLNNPWWSSVSDFAQQTADNLGVDLTIAIPQEEVDPEKRVSMIEAAIDEEGGCHRGVGSQLGRRDSGHQEGQGSRD